MQNSIYRIFLVAGIGILTILSLLLIPRLSINPSFDIYIPENVGNKTVLNRLDSIFGSNEKLLLIQKNKNGILNRNSYERTGVLAGKLQQINGIEHTFSLHNVIEFQEEDGFTDIVPLIPHIPDEPAALDSLKQKITGNLMASRLVSRDFTASAIVLTKSNNIDDQTIISEIKQVIKETPGKDEIHIGGLAFIRTSVKSYIKRDLVTLLPAALLVMIVMLFLFFREWKGVLLPFLVVILSIVFSFGLMALFDWEISLVSVLLPIMLIAIANDYGIHLINLYQEKCRENKHENNKHISQSIYRELKQPITITGLTTIGGMLGLLSHQMAPAAQLGVLASAGIGIALILSLFLIPTLLAFYKKPKKNHLTVPDNKGFLNKTLELFAKWVNHYPKTIVVTFLLISLISIGGIFLLKVDTNVEGYFAKDSQVRTSIDLTNEKFGGSQYVSILFSGNILAPDVLRRMEHYTEQIEQLPQAGNIISPVTLFKELSKGYYSAGEAGYGSLPRNQAEAAQYLEIASLAEFDEQISQLIDFNHENARILVSLTDGSNQTGKELLHELKNITGDDPLLNGIAGPGLSKIQIADMVIKGQITSLVLAFFIIIILLSFIFKSIAAGIKGSIPLLVATLFLFGLMGFTGIPLDIVTALLSSIMIGVGIDYTIHFLWRYKAEYAILHNPKSAVSATLTTTGRGIIFNALSVIIGFAVLILSGFAPLRFFGLLVVVSIFSCLMSALLLVPAIVTLTKPKFLEPGISKM
ncbi:efflux RND transporter permease subunit [Marinilabilia sp.]|uniref:efflux RND transporter permease subunit n=1 Tax=Marinilabilia sp. TaxID=2021252 RepID=UPI0025BB9EC0|nr:efflux RND transporter permease subunit [Marinilabilia sp.]